MLYWFPALQQGKSVIIIRMSPPLEPPLHPAPLGRRRAPGWPPCTAHCISPAPIVHGHASMSAAFFIRPILSPAVSSLFSISASLLRKAYFF